MTAICTVGHNHTNVSLMHVLTLVLHYSSDDRWQQRANKDKNAPAKVTRLLASEYEREQNRFQNNQTYKLCKCFLRKEIEQNVQVSITKCKHKFVYKETPQKINYKTDLLLQNSLSLRECKGFLNE